MDHEKHIALFIDGDNVSPVLLRPVFSTLMRLGSIDCSHVFYFSDSATVAARWHEAACQFKLTVHQVPRYVKGKNITDFYLIIAACDLANSPQAPDIFAVVSNDTDYLTLAEHIRTKNRDIIGFGTIGSLNSSALTKHYTAFYCIENDRVFNIASNLFSLVHHQIKTQSISQLPRPKRLRHPLLGNPEIQRAPKLGDGGFLRLTSEQRNLIEHRYDIGATVFRQLVGTKITSRNIFLDLSQAASEVLQLPCFKARLEKVRAYRSAHTDPTLRSLADQPHLLSENCLPPKSYVLLPKDIADIDGYPFWPCVRRKRTAFPMPGTLLIANLQPWQLALLYSAAFAQWLRFCAQNKPLRSRVILLAMQSFSVPCPDPIQKQRLASVSNQVNAFLIQGFPQTWHKKKTLRLFAAELKRLNSLVDTIAHLPPHTLPQARLSQLYAASWQANQIERVGNHQQLELFDL